ncbi:hypothetical protein YC2023_018545 [Brassica napus]
MRSMRCFMESVEPKKRMKVISRCSLMHQLVDYMYGGDEARHSQDSACGRHTSITINRQTPLTIDRQTPLGIDRQIALNIDRR